MYKILLTLLLTGATLFGQDKSADHGVLAKKLAQLLEQHSKALFSEACPQNLGSEIDKLITSAGIKKDDFFRAYFLIKTNFDNKAFDKFNIAVLPREEQVSASSACQRWWISARIGKCLVDIHQLQKHEFETLENMHKPAMLFLG
jgi:hypothetical protein